MTSEDFPIHLKEETYKKLEKEKEKMGFGSKSWNEWLNSVFSDRSEQKSLSEIIEEALRKNTYELFYDDWIRNFALNLENIWKEDSARNLMPQTTEPRKLSSALVIGRGPSLIKHDHLNLLANSDYRGTIICTDGILENVLNAGITPNKFKNFFVVTIDSQERISNYYDNSITKQYGSGIKSILSTTLSTKTYNAVKKAGIKVYWIHTLFDYDKGKSSFNYISGVMSRSKFHKKGLPAIQTGGNIGTAAWIIAWSVLKCSHVGLIGIDHGYYPETSWEEIAKFHPHSKVSSDVDKNSNAFKKAFPTIYNPDFNCYCIQDPSFQCYANALKEFIPKASKWVKTINATEGGSIFGVGIECMTLKNFLSTYNF